MDPDIDRQLLSEVIELACREDLSSAGDITSQLLPESFRSAEGRWQLTARQEGRFCGAAVLPEILERVAPGIRLAWIDGSGDGAAVTPGQGLARLTGNAAKMLAGERIVLNFLQHLSGIATLTARFVGAVAGTGAKIYDTRKTIPGMRALAKYAVRCGGGCNHRFGLHDAVLLKDNHLAGISVDRLAQSVFEMLNKLSALPARPKFVEVECDCLEQFEQLLKVVGIDVILLDNFSLPDLRAAVELRGRHGLRGKVELEASGGVTLDTVRSIAETGVERIAVGAMTHSAPALDLGLDAL